MGKPQYTKYSDFPIPFSGAISSAPISKKKFSAMPMIWMYFLLHNTNFEEKGHQIITQNTKVIFWLWLWCNTITKGREIWDLSICWAMTG
jgi:hypothetical protein